MKKIVLLLLLASPLLAEPPKRDWMEAFEGDEPTAAALRINYRSVGCFHAEDYEFTFEFPADNFLKVSVIQNVQTKTDGKSESRVRRVEIGSAILVGRDRERFMKLLDYY